VTNKQVILLAAALTVMGFGAKPVATGIKVVAVKTAHVVGHMVRHPIDSAKHGAIHSR
jgi:hypothetical protein